MQTFTFQIRNKSDEVSWDNIDKFIVKQQNIIQASNYGITLVKELDAQVRIDKPNDERFHARILDKDSPKK